MSEAGEREKGATRELRLLEEAALVFEQRHERLPKALAEMICDAGCELGGLPLDPWRTPYRLVSDGDGGLFFSSAGPDRAWLTSDDLASARLSADAGR